MTIEIGRLMLERLVSPLHETKTLEEAVVGLKDSCWHVTPEENAVILTGFCPTRCGNSAERAVTVMNLLGERANTLYQNRLWALIEDELRDTLRWPIIHNLVNEIPQGDTTSFMLSFFWTTDDAGFDYPRKTWDLDPGHTYFVRERGYSH